MANGLYVEDWGAINRLDRTDQKAHPISAQDSDRVQPDRVGPILASSEEHPGHGCVWFVSGMNLLNAAIGPVKPGQDYDLSTWPDCAQRLLERDINFQPGLRRTFDSLKRSASQVLQLRPDDSNRLHGIHCVGHD